MQVPVEDQIKEFTKVEKQEIAKSESHARVNRNMTDQTLDPMDSRVGDIELLRASAKEFGHLIVEACPVGREQSLALTDLESALMWAVASIARNL